MSNTVTITQSTSDQALTTSTLPSAVLTRNQADALYSPFGAGGAYLGARGAGVALVDMPFSGQAGHPFTVSGGSVNNSNDTSDFVLGSRALSVTTTGTGAQGKIAGAFTSALNLTGKCLVVWVKQSNLADFLNGYPRMYVGDANLANAYFWKLSSSPTQPWGLDGEWVRITLPFGSATAVGAPNRASLAALTIQVYDNSAGQVTFHLGGLGTMNEPTSFPNGVVSLTFDDGLLSQFTTAKPYMDKYGFTGTGFIICETLYNNASFPNYFTEAQAHALEQQSGWELGTHAYTAANHNASYTGITDAAALADMQNARLWMHQQGFKVPHLASYPSGAYDLTTLSNAAGLFAADRTISSCGGFPEETVPPALPTRLRSVALGNTISLATAEAAVDRAFANKEWLIFTLHDLVTTATTSTQWPTASFTSLMDYIATKGIPVRNVSDVLRAP